MSNVQIPRPFNETMWAGTQQSLDIAVDFYNVFSDTMAAGMIAGTIFQGSPKKEEEDEIPHLFSQIGSVGVIKIRGSLVNSDSPYYKHYSSISSYPDIRRAVVHAAKKPDVKAILLDIGSGGGAVSGVADTGNLISQIHDSVKPVYAFTDSTMASAAYWLGSSAGWVFGSSTSITGSIGVITTHMEFSKMYKEMGIGVKVMRAGEFKALGHSAEPLTAKAEEVIQEQLNAAYSIFIGHVADRRGLSVDVADRTLGQGREFFGQAGVDSGALDALTTFDRLLGVIELKTLDSGVRQPNNLTYPN